MAKKSILGLVIIAMLVTMFASIPFAQAQTPIRVLINNRALALDVPPVIEAGRTMVPMRAIFEALGAQVHWDAATRTIRAYRRESAIVLEVGNRRAWVNGPPAQIDAAPAIIEGRTMVPLRFVAEALGAEVSWDGNARAVSITHTPYTRKPIGGTITYGSIADPVVLNPILLTDTASGMVIDRTHWGLVRYDQENQPMNAIADRWEWNQQTLTWRFWLNPLARWHDGTPVTARDVKFTYETIMHPAYDGPRRAVVSQVDSINIIDDHTVDFKMKRVDAPFLFNIGLGLLPHHILGHVPVAGIRGHAYGRNPVGNGPYIFVRWVSGQFVELRRNPDFFQGPRPYIGRVVIRTYPDLNVMQTAWEAGDIDWFSPIHTDHIDRIRREHAQRAQFREVRTHAYDYISFNLENPILADRRVREALVTGLDRQSMIDTVLDGRGTLLNAHQPLTSWARGAPNLNPYTFSEARAAQLLDEAGWRVPRGSRDGVRVKDGRRLALRLSTNAGNVIRADIAAMANSYWRRIGVEVTEEIIEWSVLLDRFARGNYDMIIIGWSLGLDPDPFLMFHSSQAERGADGRIMTFNRGRFINATVDRLLDEGRATNSITERRRIYHEIDQILNRELPYIWIFQRVVVFGIANRIQGATWSPTANIWFETKYIDD